MGLPGAGGERKQVGVVQRVQSFRCTRRITPRDLVYSMEPIVNYTVLYTLQVC